MSPVWLLSFSKKQPTHQQHRWPPHLSSTSVPCHPSQSQEAPVKGHSLTRISQELFSGGWGWGGGKRPCLAGSMQRKRGGIGQHLPPRAETSVGGSSSTPLMTPGV